MFGFQKKREKQAEAQQTLAGQARQKCDAELAQCMATDDPAARYLALSDFRQRRGAEIAALDAALEKKRNDRNFKKSLAYVSPLAIAYCCTHPAGWALLGIMKMASSGLILMSPAVHVSDAMRRNGAGRKKLRAEMEGLYAPLRAADHQADAAMRGIVNEHIAALAVSPLADKITALNPALKDAMLESFRAAARRAAETPAPAATPSPAAPPPPVFKL